MSVPDGIQQRFFQCSFCPKVFMKKQNKRLHERQHTGEKPYKCQVCSAMFPRNSSLANHKKFYCPQRSIKNVVPVDITAKDKNHTCPTCNNGFQTKAGLKSHCKTHMKGISKYSCKECPAKFATHTSLTKHKNKLHFKESTKHSNKKSIKMKNSPALGLENVNHPTSSTSAEQENEGEDQNQSIQSNQSSVFSEKEMDFNSTVNKKPARLLLGQIKLENSMVKQKDILQSEEKRREHTCLICQTVFQSASNMRIHMATHENNPKHSCKDCGAKFTTTHSLAFHSRQVHPGKDNPYCRSKKLRKNIFKVSAASNGKVDKLQGTLDRFVIKSPPAQAATNRVQLPIRVRQSPDEDPHLWPKVLLSRNLNDVLSKLQ